jgi:hypothetical protein
LEPVSNLLIPYGRGRAKRPQDGQNLFICYGFNPKGLHEFLNAITLSFLMEVSNA